MMMKADDDYDERRGEVGTEAAQEWVLGQRQVRREGAAAGQAI